MGNNSDESFIEHPKIPHIIRDFFFQIKLLLHKLMKLKLSFAAKSGLYNGLIFALIYGFVLQVLYGVTSLLQGIIFGFIFGFVTGSLIGAIVDALPPFDSYTTGQKIGIGIGFTLAFIAFVFVIGMIDVYLLNNNVYQLLLLMFMVFKNIGPAIGSFFKNAGSGIGDFLKDFLNTAALGANQRIELIECLKKYAIMLGGIAFISVVLYYASRDPSALTTNTNSYALMILIPMLISFFIFSPLLRADESPYLIALGGGVLITIFAMLLYYSSTWNLNAVYYGGFVMRILLTAIIIVGLALFFKLNSANLKKLPGWYGFFANLLFFIPCLFSDAMQYLFQQIRITPSVVFLLLVIELVLMVLYILLPPILQKIYAMNSTSLLSKPVFLNREIAIANSERFLYKPMSDSVAHASNDELYRRNYSMTMWVYLNPQPSSNAAYVKETTIFDYGNGKPKLAYKNDSGNKRQKDTDIYVVYFTNNGENMSYELSLPNQKWNYFAFNFFDSKVDLYVNGSLARTFTYTDNIPVYSPIDIVIVGSDNGLDGSICNVNYYTEPLTSSKITDTYNLLMLKNPPTDYVK